jgi:CheY-like chemotaxis protein
MTKILLVEDDKSLREIYGVRLLAEGYDIISAGDGEAALAMAIKERPSLIVSDVMMPKISGFDMLDILRSTTETKNIKVIMMTALSSEDQRARGEALGADRYLVKSQVGIEDVVRTVHDVLGDAPVSTASAVQTFGGPSTPPRPATAVPAAPPRSPQPLQQTMPTPPPFTAGAAPQPRPAQLQPAATTPSSSGLPQPTAPFSTTRPANLGERVLHPVVPSGDQKPDIGSLMAQELNQADPQSTAAPMSTPPLPTPPPAPSMPLPQQPSMPAPEPPTPQAAPAPIGIAPTPMPPAPVSMPPAPMAPPSLPPQAAEEDHTGISFEETPRTPGAQPPSGPFSAQPPRP